MSLFRSCFHIAVLFTVLIQIFEAYEIPRGVPESRVSFYQIGEPFKCLDGSGVIPWHQLNDNYCHCPDGSDEPGTSACSNGRFFCRDTQYKIVSIRSAFVNDGICDCCDGSDEYSSGVVCESTCSTLAAAVEQARLVKRKQFERGHELFNEYVAKLKVRKEEERIAAEQAERERQAMAEQAEQSAHSEVATDTETINKVETTEPATTQIGDTDDYVTKEPHEEGAGDAYDEKEHVPDDKEEHSREEEEQAPTKAEEQRPPIDYGPEEAFRMLEDLPDCLEFSETQYTYRLCAFQDVYQRDAGSSGHGTLLGRWSGWGTDQDDASTNHGYRLMRFTNGQGCWNGPQRSVKVHVHCGDENKITDVKEPSRCEYEMQLYTPAACFEHPEVLLNRIHSEL